MLLKPSPPVEDVTKQINQTADVLVQRRRRLGVFKRVAGKRLGVKLPRMKCTHLLGVTGSGMTLSRRGVVLTAPFRTSLGDALSQNGSGSFPPMVFL